ncbi:translocation protein SEC63 [Teratosphaeria destructans]|uniref:Translocation protein SEC63 n=1 Tax=Teratosphaeria destructans TaxID=418781 RepID=A0A9W7T021_9PEZI|nr:translocation protein SEC63 [Teratosphaeria destructans]
MSAEYNYDTDAQYFPFFVLTIASLITLPLSYSLVRAPSDATAVRKAPHIASNYEPEHADIITAQRSKQKRKELRLKRMLTAAAGWAVMAWMVFLMYTMKSSTAAGVWDPYEILGVQLGSNEKTINSRYRRLSITMHPDKRQPNPALNETTESVNDQWVEIVKAYKTLTDEDVRKNWEEYGNPDGKQSTSFGIALPQLLVAEGSGKYVLLFYGALLGVALPWLVGKWWYGMQKMTKERVLVTSAGNMFREFKEKMDESDVIGAVSAANEYKDILRGAKAENGLGSLEKTLFAAADANPQLGFSSKDRKKVEESEDVVRRKTMALIWSYLTRLELPDKTLEGEKYEVAPTAIQMNEAFLSICLAYGFTSPVLASYHLSQSLVQAVPPTQRAPLLQLPHFTPAIAKQIEHKTQASQKKEHLSVQSFLSLPAEQRATIAESAGLSASNLKVAEDIAHQLPRLQVEKAFFKVQGEKYMTPSALIQFVVKARFVPPGATNVPPVNPEDLKDVDPAEGDLQAQKVEPERHPLPLAHAPYFPQDRAPRYHVFLADHRQGKIAVPPFTFRDFDKPAFKEVDGKLVPTYNVVTLKMQFQAPPQAGEYKFQMHILCDSYLGFDTKQEAIMMIEDASKAQQVEEEDEISEPEEDSIAGQMASLRGQPTDDPEKRARREARRKANEAKKLQQAGGDDESDYESGTDEDEESESETDTSTDEGE